MQLLKSSPLQPCRLKQPSDVLLRVVTVPSSKAPLATGKAVSQRRRQHGPVRAATDDDMSSADVKELANFISAQPMDDAQRMSYSGLANVLQVPLSTIKGMAFKKKGFANLTPDELREKIETIARVVEVSEDKARQMVIIQPGLCFDTDKQAETLKFGIQTICWELEASKEEVVNLILENQSVLHGRKLHLSVADIAHLAMLREPKGRVVD